MDNDILKLKSIKDKIVSPKPDPFIPMYRIHKYWARKPWFIVKEYIENFSKPCETVLDPFCGSGVTGVESLILNRNSVMVDLNPMATFVTEMTAANHDIAKNISENFLKIKNVLETKINDLYKIEEKCEQCGSKLIGISFNRGPKFTELSTSASCLKCGLKKSTKVYQLTKIDLKKLNNIENNEEPGWFPTNCFPEKFDKDRITYKGMESVDKLYTRRNLIALSWVLIEIEKISDVIVKKLLLLSFSDTVLHCSKLKASKVRPMSVNNYWVPDDWIEENVWMRFTQRVSNLIKGKKIASNRIGKSKAVMQVYTRSSSDLNKIVADNSIDFIFTDPPYGDSIQYQELSMVWNFWLKNKPNYDDEIIINRSRKKNVDNYKDSLRKVFQECYRVLKMNKYMVVTFHNKEFKVWLAILKSIQESGFLFIGLNSHDPLGNSYNKNWSKRSPKTDLYMLFKKGVDKNQQLKFNAGELDYEKIIQESVSKKSNISLNSIYDSVLEKCISHVFDNQDYNSLKNLDIYLIDKLSEYYEKYNK